MDPEKNASVQATTAALFMVFQLSPQTINFIVFLEALWVTAQSHVQKYCIFRNPAFFSSDRRSCFMQTSIFILSQHELFCCTYKDKRRASFYQQMTLVRVSIISTRRPKLLSKLTNV